MTDPMTDHPDLLALRAAVLAAPADDVPRLVFADRLEELDGTVECVRREAYWFGSRHVIPHPRPRRHSSALVLCPDCSGTGRVPNGYAARAEFIRLQCEIAELERERADRLDDDHGDRRFGALRERERELLGNHGEQWAKDALGDHYRPFLHGGGRAVFRRGFVDEIHCPLRLWVGEPCPGCIEPGELDDGDPRCRLCHGLGTVGGIGPELVRRCPLSRVTLTDREPAHEIHVNYEIGIPAVGWGWCRVPGAQPDRRHHLPPELFDLLDLPTCPSYPAIKQAPTRQAALDAQSAACLGWARATPTNTTESPREGATR